MVLQWSDTAPSYEGPNAGMKKVKVLIGLLTVLPMGLVLVWTLATMGQVKGLGFSLPHVGGDFDLGPEADARKRELWRTFNWHPVCMTVAFSCLFTEALLVFRLLDLGWRSRKFVHAGLQLGALVFATLGITDIVLFKTAYEQEHFYSSHSWLGISTYSLFTLQFVVGSVFLLRPRWFVRFFPAHESYVRTVLPWHILAGQSIYFGATLSLVTGVVDRQMLFELYDQVSNVHDARFLVGNALAFAVAGSAYVLYMVHSKSGGGAGHSGDDYYRAM